MRYIILELTEKIIKSFNFNQDFINDWKKVIDLSWQSKELNRKIRECELNIKHYAKSKNN